MKIRKKITIYNGHNRKEPALINSCKQDALSGQSRDMFNASTYNKDKKTSASKAVERNKKPVFCVKSTQKTGFREYKKCSICENYDYYYGECMNNYNCTRVKFRLRLTHKAATQANMNRGLSRNVAGQF